MSGWSALEINGKPADVYDPPGPDRPRFAVLYLHGAGLETLHSVYAAAYTPLLAELRLACVCPHAGLSWWTDRVFPDFDPARTAEQFVLGDVLPFFRRRWEIEPRAVGLFGVGMGGQGALRMGFKHPETFPVVAALSAAVECQEVYGAGYGLEEMYDSKEQCRQDTAPMHVHPSRQPSHLFFAVDPDDAWLRGNDRLHEKLNALGVEHTTDFETRGGGHSWAYFNRMAERVLRFLRAVLEQESRRLL
jgi:esterase/lipase superfamily enzyme